MGSCGKKYELGEITTPKSANFVTFYQHLVQILQYLPTKMKILTIFPKNFNLGKVN